MGFIQSRLCSKNTLPFQTVKKFYRQFYSSSKLWHAVCIFYSRSIKYNISSVFLLLRPTVMSMRLAVFVGDHRTVGIFRIYVDTRSLVTYF